MGVATPEVELYVSNWLVVKQGGVEEPCTAVQLVAIFGSITVARNVPLNPPPGLICAFILLSEEENGVPLKIYILPPNVQPPATKFKYLLPNLGSCQIRSETT